MGRLVETIEESVRSGRLFSESPEEALERGIDTAVSVVSSVPAVVAARYAADPWKWVTECVWTLDQADAKQPIKRFPACVCLACREYRPVDDLEEGECQLCGSNEVKELSYLRILTETWARLGEDGNPPILFVPKPRRMRASWLFVALHTWLAVFRKGSAVFFQSSKEDKSAELLDRAQHILEHLPPERMGKVPFERFKQPHRIELPQSRSFIMAVGEGPNQLRQYTVTAILMDEIGTWNWPRASWGATKPAIEGGGRITAVSSAYPGFWASCVQGELEG